MSQKKLLLGVILSVFWEKSASGWGNVKNSKGSFYYFPGESHFYF